MADQPRLFREYSVLASTSVLPICDATILGLPRAVVEYEEFSMSSMLSTQSQDCGLTCRYFRGEGGSMRLAQDFGESGWDNG